MAEQKNIRKQEQGFQNMLASFSIEGMFFNKEETEELHTIATSDTENEPKKGT